MTYTISPEEFLAQRDPEEPDELDLGEQELEASHIKLEAAYAEFDEAVRPLASIAESLRLIAHRFEPASPEAGSDLHKAHAELEDRYDQLLREYDDSEAKNQALTELVDEVLAVCKPSVSKLANQVRETVERWRKGHEVTAVEEAPVEGVA